MKRADTTIAVTGATGQQGGATTARLLADGWRVRALVRDPQALAARALSHAGAELAVVNLDDRATLDAAIRGAYGVYSVQPSTEKEYLQGKNVADAAHAAGVRHLIYMSVGGAPGQARYRTLAKWDIENHIRSLGVPATILRPAGFMEDFTTYRFGVPSGRLAVPFNADVVVQLIAVADIGAFAALAFAQPETYVGQVLNISGDAMTAPQIAEALGRAAGRPIPYVQIPIEILRQKSPEAASVFDWVNNEYYTTDIPALRALHPGLMTFENWLDAVGAARLATASSDLRADAGA